MSAVADLPEQSAVEHIVAQQEQLHSFTRMVLTKTPMEQPVSTTDSDGVLARYWELMQSLRRYERAMTAAASDLDPLTGLRTRAGMMHDLGHELSRFERTGRVFCAVIADIDHFKAINDTHGHDMGDRVLASVADHITRVLRAYDDAYRMGGEEFLLCLKETDLAGGLSAIERLRKSMREKPIILPDSKTVSITMSFGIAMCEMETKPEELLHRADGALYRAKNEGRDRVISA